MLDIIVNPAGAGGRTLKFFRREVLPLLGGAQYRVHYSSKEHGISDIVRELTGKISPDREYVNLVIVGGDGTMNEALNGIMDFTRTRIGLIPAGSGNDLAKDLGLSISLEENIGRIRAEAVLRQADIGQTILHDSGKKQYFIVSSGAGFDAQCCQMAAAAPMKNILNKAGLGKLIYLYEAMKLIFTWKSPVAAAKYIRNDAAESAEKGSADTQHFDRFVFAAAMNHRFEGGGFMMCPDADGNDGLLDFCLVQDLGRMDFFRLFPSAAKGAHVKSKRHVTIERGTGIRVRCEVPLWIHCDGEAIGQSTDAEMRISGLKLNILN